MYESFDGHAMKHGQVIAFFIENDFLNPGTPNDPILTFDPLTLSYQGGAYHPPSVCHKNAKESDPGHLEHLFYILCGHFDEKKTGVPPTMGVG